MIRTADARRRASVVIVAAGSVDVWSGKCVRASAGSVLHLPIVDGVSAESAIAGAAQRVASCSPPRPTASDDLDDLIDAGTLSAPTVWLFGNEAHGVSRGRCAGCADRVVRVPVYGRAESLNLAAAAAICLYVARAQAAASATP